jgi:polyisoprenoid-binding protein YceI
MRRLREKLINKGAAAVLVSGILMATAHRLPAQTAPATASEVVFVLTLDPAQSQLHWNVDSSLHMVHGTFALKSGTVRLNSETGKADGEIVVSAPSGESGNGGRDKRMHKEILETAKYPEVIFRPTHIEGRVSRSGISDVKLSGIFSIHGTDHELTSQVHAELIGDHWTSTSKFEVPYVQWGIKDPSNFFLKVKPVVHVELEMSGEIKSPT